MTDTERLDMLQKLMTGYGKGWVLRLSSEGRGLRLHETHHEDAVPDVREAIDMYIKNVEDRALSQLRAFAPGDRVVYVVPHKVEFGIVKSVHPSRVFVVYHFSNHPERYQDYTAVATSIDTLVHVCEYLQSLSGNLLISLRPDTMESFQYIWVDRNGALVNIDDVPGAENVTITTERGAWTIPVDGIQSVVTCPEKPDKCNMLVI